MTRLPKKHPAQTTQHPTQATVDDKIAALEVRTAATHRKRNGESMTTRRMLRTIAESVLRQTTILILFRRLRRTVHCHSKGVDLLAKWLDWFDAAAENPMSDLYLQTADYVSRHRGTNEEDDSETSTEEAPQPLHGRTKDV